MASFKQGTQSPTFHVETGFWTDWSYSPIFGATITLRQREGVLLVAFLALFVNFVGISFWRISCFTLHHLYSTEVAQDALHHQRQAILRNSANGTDGLLGFFNVLWVWRSKAPARTAYRRILPMIGFTIFCIGAFGTASTFSSRISTSMSKNVLVRSPTCGLLYAYETANANDTKDRLEPFIKQKFTSYLKYAQNCYMSRSDLESCDAFSTRLSNTKIMRNASCPFRDGICKSEYGNIMFDTGYLDSHIDFSLNTRPDERVLFRRVTSCAPLKSEGYSNTYSSPVTGLNYTRFYYGSGAKLGEDDLGLSYTYEYPELTPIILRDEVRLDQIGGAKTYTIQVTGAFAFNGSYHHTSSFYPIPALQHPDADVYIAFLSADRISYSNKVDDPWFSAHVGGFGSHHFGEGNDSTTLAYFPDNSVSPLACTVQEQFCNPNLASNDSCPPLGGSSESGIAAAGLWKTTRHQEVFNWFAASIRFVGSPIAVAPLYTGAESLLAKYKLAYGYSTVLPDDQWQLEMENWHATSLVTTQGGIVDVAKGWPKDLEPWVIKPSNDVQKALCNSQKVPNPGYFNFSVFALSFTLALGTIIICLSYALEPLTSCIQRRRNLDTYGRLEWSTNEFLQLQRLAHEELGIGEWEGCTSDVPTTKGKDRLAVLDLDDLGHPRLKAPVQPFDETIPTQGIQKEATLVEVEQKHDAALATGRA